MATRVEITNRESAAGWLATQDHQTQVWFATRCALRVLPALANWDNATSNLDFATCRAMLISGAASTCPALEMKVLKQAAANATADAALAAASAVYAAASPTAANAAAAAAAAANATAANVRAAANARATINSVKHFWRAATEDANAPMNWENLWHGDPPDAFSTLWDDLKAQWQSDGPHWTFWIKWYEAIQAGKWKDWDLIFQIAKTLEADDWDKGAVHVAAEIAAIEEKLKGPQRDTARQQAFEPQSVERLFDNRRTICAGAAALSALIRDEFKAFTKETGLNQTPEPLLPLAAMPRTLDKIVDLISTRSRTDDTEQALREEVGRLKALVAELANKLSEAKDEIATHENNSWIRTAAKTIASAHVFGVVATTVWTISGDDVGPQNRWENIIEYRDFVIGEAEEDKTPSRRLPQIRSD